ncbi:hypothetical protein F4810DRAFT_721664 [Camillea tinctor]|nr:hypothetical protein F4810DRAFT_721664 [Camillea tinctor]
MDVNGLPNSCQTCRKASVTCEHILASPTSQGCIECSTAGEGCSIPAIENAMVLNGISTVGHGHRPCVRCATKRLPCTFTSDTRPAAPCIYCIETLRACCVMADENLVPESCHGLPSYEQMQQPIFSDEDYECMSYADANPSFYAQDPPVPEDMQVESQGLPAEGFYPEVATLVGLGDSITLIDLQRIRAEMELEARDLEAQVDLFVSQLPASLDLQGLSN